MRKKKIQAVVTIAERHKHGGLGPIMYAMGRLWCAHLYPKCSTVCTVGKRCAHSLMLHFQQPKQGPHSVQRILCSAAAASANLGKKIANFLHYYHSQRLCLPKTNGRHNQLSPFHIKRPLRQLEKSQDTRQARPDMRVLSWLKIGHKDHTGCCLGLKS
jgi:hypothetical protein